MTKIVNMTGSQVYTGPFWHTERTAINSANFLTKRNGRYYSIIKGKQDVRGRPDECWAVTDRWSDFWMGL